MTQAATRRTTRNLTLDALLDSYQLALAAENKSPHTIRSYADSGELLISWARANATTDIAAWAGDGGTVLLRTFFAAELARKPTNRRQAVMSPASVDVTYRSLRAWFNWISREEPAMLPVSPMGGVGRPVVPEGDKSPFTPREQAALLATCNGSSFADRRDYAIMSVFVDTGMRVSGCAGLQLRYYSDDSTEQTDIRLKDHRLLLRLKGGRIIRVPIGRKTTAACDRYSRIRATHPHADLDAYWLSPLGAFSHWGIRQMLERRGKQAGVAGVFPHRFRGTFAHDWLLAGGSESDLMEICGWETRAMIEVYTRPLRQTRAGISHARLSPRDRI